MYNIRKNYWSNLEKLVTDGQMETEESDFIERCLTNVERPKMY